MTADRSTAAASPAEFAERLASWEAREADPAGWEQRVETAARAIVVASDPYDPYDWADYRRLAVAALSADARQGSK